MRNKKHYILLVAYIIALTALLISVTSCTPTKEIKGSDGHIYKVRKCQTCAKLFSKRRQTEDEKQLQFFKEQIKLKSYYYANR